VTIAEYLVSPEKFIAVPVLQTEPGIHKLIYTVAPHKFRKVLCLIPVEGSSKRQEAHDLKDEDLVAIGQAPFIGFDLSRASLSKSQLDYYSSV